MTAKASFTNVLLPASITLLAIAIFVFAYEIKRTRDGATDLIPELNLMISTIDAALDQHLDKALVEVKATRDIVPELLNRVDAQLNHIDQQLLDAQKIAGSAGTDAASGAVKGVAKGLFYDIPKAVITAPSRAYEKLDEDEDEGAE